MGGEKDGGHDRSGDGDAGRDETSRTEATEERM
jgi:hypothetical protein